MRVDLSLSLTFRQVLNLIKQLPERQKIKITKKLEKEVIDSKLSDIFKSFQTYESLQDLIDKDVEVVRQKFYNDFINETSIVNDVLAKIFPKVIFEECDTDLDHTCDVDYIGKVGSSAFGIQLKPITANANFGSFKPSERMQTNFEDFEEKYGGRVFIVFSTKVNNKKEIQNKDVILEITKEIERLTLQQF
jgi:hypothetical protein